MKQKKIYWFASDPRAKIPTQEKNSVGYDLYALPEENFQGTFVLHPGEKHIFHTGLKCIIPDDYWLSFWERSSTGNLQMNLHAGVIDSSYRGELMIILANYTNYDMVFNCDDKKGYEAGKIYYPFSKAIAQGILLPKLSLKDETVADSGEWNRLCEKFQSERGEGGFGSSGK